MKNKLIIIGNGFDIWQGLNTRYSDFTKYYYAHRDAILKRLFIRGRGLAQKDSNSPKLSDVELIYGDAFDPNELDYDFWHSFEASLAQIDDERVNLYFGKEKSGLRSLAKSVGNTQKILHRAFTDWIKTIEITEEKTPYKFDDTCTFLNFNYTDTLQIRFNVPEENIHFIHGEAKDKKSIIFGHSSHPHPPDVFAKRLGGRFLGLYYIEELLYQMDKQVAENIDIYCMYLAMSGIKPEDISRVYVLGHSFGEVDFEYFRFLADATRATATWRISCFSDSDRRQVKATMKKLMFNNYIIYPGIDECLADFKI